MRSLPPTPGSTEKEYAAFGHAQVVFWYLWNQVELNLMFLRLARGVASSPGKRTLRWERGFAALSKFRAREGHCCPPRCHSNNSAMSAVFPGSGTFTLGKVTMTSD